jgi:electron transport complex protein RnfC
MLLAKSSGKGQANIHSSVPGQVLDLTEWEMADGFVNKAIVIRLEGAFDRLGKAEQLFPWQDLTRSELHGRIDEYGVVEMDGPGKPLCDTLDDFKDAGVTVVLRAVFDNPWLAGDYRLCAERTEDVALGAVITAKAAGAGRVVIAVSYPEQGLGQELLEKASAFAIPVSLVLTGDRYPQRNERELEYSLRQFETREAVPLGSLLFLGIPTAAAVFDAAARKRPVLERYVAVGGSAVRHPSVVRARIGTRLGAIFDECGGFVKKPSLIAAGSPLLGRRIASLDEPVMKTTGAAFALLPDPLALGPSKRCIGCGECRHVCPVGLDPEELFKRINVNAGDLWEEAGLKECHGCGCCEIVCPSKLPLSTVIMKTQFKEAGDAVSG